MARELADAGHRVHIAGNAYDELDEHGVLVHRYGPHIFHANGERIFESLSRFTEWRPYEHRVDRSLRFEHEYLPNTDRFEGADTVNYPNDQAYTRTTESQ